MENETQPFTPTLAELGSKTPKRAKIEWRDGIIFDLRYLSRSEFQKMAKDCTVRKFDPALKARTESVDGEKFTNTFCSRIMLGWEGLTVRKAANLIDLRNDLTEEQLDTPVPFSMEQAAYLIKNCYDLDTFLQQTATDLAQFNAGQDEEVKN